MTVACYHRSRHHPLMSSGSTQGTTPDLFSAAAAREPSSPAGSQPTLTPAPNHSAASADSRPSVLPRDLPTAIKHLDDQELDRLAAASFAELIRRGRKPPIQDETSFKRRVEDATASLTPGRLNAVRAAFRAGVTPSKIARQFAIPHSDVRKALAGESSTRAPSRD